MLGMVILQSDAKQERFALADESIDIYGASVSTAGSASAQSSNAQ